MPSPRIITFEKALEETASDKRHLLLGNGFSIALFKDCFCYESLLEQADFKGINEARRAFDELKTTNFEIVMKALAQSAILLPLYSENAGDVVRKMQKHTQALKERLVHAIAGRHPEKSSNISDEQCAACQSFLVNFIGEGRNNKRGNIYTLNYDLLLYWVLLRELDDTENLYYQDGFRSPDGEPNADYVTWDDGIACHTQNLYFLHGALHLFDRGLELQKKCWERSGGIALVDQIREALSDDKFPLYVAEGESEEKLSQIRHSGYLHRAFRSFSEIGGSLFVYGHSLAPSDEHILKKIEAGKTKRLYISIYGDQKSPGNKAIFQRAQQIMARRDIKHPLEISYFDAAEANVWGDQDEGEEYSF